MDDIARGCVEEHVLAVPVTQAHNVPHLLTTHTASESHLTSYILGHL